MYLALVLINYVLFSTKPKLLKKINCELDIKNSQIFVSRDYAGSFCKLYRFATYLWSSFACMYGSNSVISNLRAEIVNCHLLFLYLCTKAEQRQSVIIYWFFFCQWKPALQIVINICCCIIKNFAVWFPLLFFFKFSLIHFQGML